MQRADELLYWSDGIGRLDARLYKLAGESLWFIWDWFRKRRVEVKEQGLKLKDEPITWMGLHEKKQWDRATTGRKIRFYLKHRNTPDEELSGQSTNYPCGNRVSSTRRSRLDWGVAGCRVQAPESSSAMNGATLKASKWI